ncbi:hypothetical protein HETIRDRAFT_163185 [Heterobasidion irregulare TC 32-1]|uniref:Uncharacterized protein n=1 Tax=Heterobasidion irregulare (strain TC 32-1) TaxID=747525 RepID=W4KCG3_HETIT|nr:uncharacterized protein HETIRDRAFT_163185 [Heterobasidion irregulare TC 32-1]ETW82761.1 hypothetical protein HETIRDRAFT_163185 [Heterobasidion irregulare TC 32-1]
MMESQVHGMYPPPGNAMSVSSSPEHWNKFPDNEVHYWSHHYDVGAFSSYSLLALSTGTSLKLLRRPTGARTAFPLGLMFSLT